jgi:uncharacterized membrane protein YgcG
MKINVYKQILPVFFILLTIFSLDFNYAKAESNPDVYSNLNDSTKIFVQRLNQLPQDFVFNKNLKRGVPVSPDVKYLKWILNSDPSTALTDNPNMTLSELTAAFGPITENAVKRFQNVYRSEILDPQGIKNPTGIVGLATRKKLNSLLTKSRLIANYSNVLNKALVVQSTNNNSNNYVSGNSDYVNFSNLDTLNLDTIFNNYYDVSTSTPQYTEAETKAESYSDQAVSGNSNNNSNNDNKDKNDPTTGIPAVDQVNQTLSSSPAPGAIAPYTLMGIIALTSGDFIGANIMSYLAGKGTGMEGMKNLVFDAIDTASLGKTKLSQSGGGSQGSSGSSGDSSSGSLGAAAGGAAAGGAGSAGSQSMLSQFGGRISFTKICDCSANELITLMDKGTNSSLSIMYQPGISSLKMNYALTVGQTILGGYIRGAATCMIYAGTTCTSFGSPSGTIDTMRGVGTTLTPSN